MNPLKIAIGVWLIIGIGLLIKLVTHIDGGIKKPQPDTIGNKISYGKIIMWVMIVAVIAALGLIASKYVKKGWKGGTVSKSAFYSWKKLRHQRGYDEKKRATIPLKAEVKFSEDKKMLSFIVYSSKGKSYFDGWKVGTGTDEFQGKWRCPSTNSGGEWKLKKKSDNPEIYVGVETDPSLPSLEDGKLSELIILD